MKRFTLALGLLFVVAACGGGESGEQGSDATTVSSPDGKAVLTLAAGSLPDGVTVDDLQIDWAEGLSDEPGAPGVGVRLSPDGLVLHEEATLRLELPDSVAGHVVVTHVTSNGFTLIGGDIEPADGTRSLTTEVEHFSSIFVYGVPGLTTFIAEATPNIVAVGQTQLVTSEVWIEPVPLNLWIPTAGNDKKSQMYTFDGIRPSTGATAHAGSVAWNDAKDDSKSWDPEVTSAQDTTDDVLVAFAGSSMCKIVNSIDPRIMNIVELTMDVTAVGAVIDQALIEFGRSVGQTLDEGFSRDTDDDDNLIPFAAAVGDTVKGKVLAITDIESECVTSISETTTTVPDTTTMPDATTTTAGETSQGPPGQDPRAHVVSITPKATENNTVGLSVAFAQPWGMEPPFDLFSFFVMFNVLQGNLSAVAGWEVHNEVVTPFGPGPTFLMSDGTVFIDTGFALGPGAQIDVTGNNGSMDSETATPVFDEFVFVVDPTEPLPIDPNDPVWDLVNNSPLP